MSDDTPFSETCPGCDPAVSSRGTVVIVTGLSGAGKTTALKALEDQGYEAVDNLPLMFLASLIGDDEEQFKRPLAVGIDIRTRDFDVARFSTLLDALRANASLSTSLLFLDADDEVIARRYTETRRRHPIGGDLPLVDGIELERRMLSPLRDRADMVLDTSRMPVGQIKTVLETRFSSDVTLGMVVTVLSFGFRNGLPREADLVFDVRFLRNPHYVAELRPLTGRHPAVGAYVAEDPDFDGFFSNLKTLLKPLLPRYDSEGKSYLTIAVGCTGGKHRSVFTAERLAGWLEAEGRKVILRHRDKPEEQGTVASAPPAG